jgi:hypothetical protein
LRAAARAPARRHVAHAPCVPRRCAPQLKKHIDEALALRQYGSTKGKPLDELASIEAIEAACAQDNYMAHGLMGKDGLNRLSGPGIPHMSGVGGAMHTGGVWPRRLVSVCRSLIDKLADGDEYEFFSDVWWPHTKDDAADDARAPYKKGGAAQAICVEKMQLCSAAEFAIVSAASAESIAAEKKKEDDAKAAKSTKKKKRKSKKRKRKKKTRSHVGL